MEYDDTSPLNIEGNLKLYIAGFSFTKKISFKENSVKEIVNIDYTNPSDFSRFTENLKLNDLKTKFYDSYLKDSEFKMNAIKIEKSGIETVTVSFETNYLEKQFKRLKNKMKKQMKRIN